MFSVAWSLISLVILMVLASMATCFVAMQIRVFPSVIEVLVSSVTRILASLVILIVLVSVATCFVTMKTQDFQQFASSPLLETDRIFDLFNFYSHTLLLVFTVFHIPTLPSIQRDVPM